LITNKFFFKNPQGLTLHSAGDGLSCLEQILRPFPVGRIVPASVAKTQHCSDLLQACCFFATLAFRGMQVIAVFFPVKK